MSENKNSLSGVHVLFTRPETRVSDFASFVESEGGVVTNIPLIEIKALPDTRHARYLLDRLTEFDICIFVSRSAVNYAYSLQPNLTVGLGSRTIMAMGPGTAGDLSQKGVKSIITGTTRGGSEALLEQSALCADNVKGKRVLIFRGLGGREFLSEELHRREALTEYVELYQRVLPENEIPRMSELWRSRKPDVVVISSPEGLENLLHMAGMENREAVLKSKLVVISPRLKQKAREKGFTADVLVCSGFSDDELLSGLHEICKVKM